MYQCLATITVQQIPTDDFPGRNLLLTMTSLIHYDMASTWEQLTQTLKLNLPKNVKIKATDVNGNIYSLGSIDTATSNVGGFNGGIVPTFLRGDIITFNMGYRAILNGAGYKEVTYVTGAPDPLNNNTQLPNLFYGFISKASPFNKRKTPKGHAHSKNGGLHANLAGFTLECEDYMWLLKQVPTPTKQWQSSNIPKICKTCIDNALNNPLGSILATYAFYGINIIVGNCDALELIFNVGNFWTRGEPLSQTLARIKHQYKLDSWFVGNTLYIGLTHYIPSAVNNHNFTFQQNILDGAKLDFKRKDDTILSCIVKSHYAVETGNTTKDGHPVTKSESTEILVYVDKKGKMAYLENKKGVEYPPNEEGKRFTFTIYDTITSVKKLFDIGQAYLQRYYYDGLTGSFITFGIPYVKHGDSVTLSHPALPELDGVYMVKGVYPYGGVEDGWRQEIFLDYRVDNIQPE